MLEDGLEYTWKREEGYNLESVSFNVLYYYDDTQVYYPNGEMVKDQRIRYSIHTYADVISQETKFTPEVYQTYTDEWFDAYLKIQTDLPSEYLHQIRKKTLSILS